MNLNLPKVAVPNRVSLVQRMEANTRTTFADLKGPGCIRHIWGTAGREGKGRKVIIRVYFDDEPVPYIEAPFGDFFGVMHGLPWYPINTPHLAVTTFSGYNSYFDMPFARSARIEMVGENEGSVYLFVNWHRFPDQELEEPRRFCARWRREAPTERYGEDFLLLDADGPGQLLGFVYGVRLYDDVDRWSHGGGDNIYIDGDGEHPAYLRGIGGEDTFGGSFGGALHSPTETLLYTGLPYYTLADVGQARPAQRLVGYRFFEHDSIEFRKSIHVRFGSMCNDICATSYWYQEGPVRPFFEMPDWPLLQPAQRFESPWGELPRGTFDLDLPDSGSWWLCGPFWNREDRAMDADLEAETEFDAEATHDGKHEEDSNWLTEGSRELGRDVARWIRRSALRGFVDFNHVFRPQVRGTPGHSYDAAAIARCVLEVKEDTTASIRLAWDDRMTLRVNADDPIDLGHNDAFEDQTVQVDLGKGRNAIVIKLSNTKGSNYCGWTFSFLATLPDGKVVLPRAE